MCTHRSLLNNLLVSAARGLVAFCLGLAATGCADLPPVTSPAPVVSPVPTRAAALPATPTTGLSPSPAPTLVTAQASPVASLTPLVTPGPLRQTPATLMLHRKNYTFDSLQFLSDFLAILKQTDLQPATYRQLSDQPELALARQGRLCIITIDDIYLRYPIDPSVLQMIDLLRAAGYPAVLGVITEGDLPYPETVKTLRQLQALGWEIASHSDTHRNLADMEKVAPKSILPEVRTSLDKLEAALGLRPVTLILPEGQMTRGELQLKRTGVRWVVGIAGGTTYDINADFYYVGREGPDGSAENTLAIMLKRFAAHSP